MLTRPLIGLFLAVPAAAQTNATLNNITVRGNLNNIQYAGVNGASAAVSDPSIRAGMISTSAGGRVMAGTYAAKISFNGSSGGETIASPSSADVVTSGSTSTLIVAPGDAPAGAASFNVYVRTTSGSYWRQSGCNDSPIGTPCIISTTPLARGSTPPTSNTAISILPGSQQALSGGPGAVVIPSNVSTNAGAMGDPASGQILYDYRTGSVSQRTSVGSVQKNVAAGTPSFIGYDLDFVVPSQIGPFQSIVALNVNCHAANNPSYYAGPATSPNVAAANFGCERAKTRTENLWGLAIAMDVHNNSGNTVGVEVDLNNATGSLSQGYNGGAGYLASAGNGPSWTAYFVDHTSSSGTFLVGYGCNMQALQTSPLAGSCFAAGASNGDVRGLDSGSPVHIFNHGNQFDVLQLDSDTSNANVAIDFSDNSTVKWRIAKNSSSDLVFTASNAANKMLIGFGGGTSFAVTNTGLLNTVGLQSFNTTTSCTTAPSAGAACTTSPILLPIRYSDIAYRAQCTGLSPTNVPVVQTVTKSKAGFTITIVAITAAAATFASFDCTITHN
jgi:hypothetical protein